MNKLKFRAWNKIEKVMYNWKDQCDMILDAIPIDMGDEWTEQCIVMQCTGTKDKNGKEIYEGDIVDFNGTIDSIVWHEADAGFVGAKHTNRFIFHWCDSIKVIGNIYENPELIGESDE